MKKPVPGKLTLGQLGKRAGLARSSLLHYEALGLLAPAGRSSAGYRLYGAPELERLLTICRLRDAGLALAVLDEAMQRWHIEFERESPRNHTAFLKSLGIESAEIAAIRRWSKEG